MSGQEPARPRIVAELGRPETPDETAARKAEARRTRRANQTLFNLVVATIASLGIALFIGLLLSNAGDGQVKAVDYRAVARDAQAGIDVPLTVPKLPDGWRANRADLETEADGTVVWQIGFVTPSNTYVAVVQGVRPSDGWLTAAVDRARSTGQVQAGAVWTAYDRRSESDPGNYAYTLSLERADSDLVLHGTASGPEFRTLARAVLASLPTNGAPG